MPVIVPNSFQSTPGQTIMTEPWLRHNWNNFTVLQFVTDGTGIGQTGVTDYPWGIDTQNHIDLSTFMDIGEDIWSFSAGSTFTPGYQASYNNWPGAVVGLPSGTSTFTNFPSPMDLTEMGGGTIALALPGFPLADIDLTNSFLEFSSDPNFATDIGSLAWDDSLTSAIAGDSALTWDLSSLLGPDWTMIQGIRLSITATSPCNVTMMALRLLGPSWIPTNMDFDTVAHQYRQTIPLTGDPALVNLPANQQVPALFRSDNPSDDSDPSPVDAEIGFLFNTGSQAGIDFATIYMRQNTNVPNTQYDLQGLTQNQLSGLPQPQFEEAPGESWISFMVRWGVNPLIQITNAKNPNEGYIYPTGFTFADNTSYWCVCTLHNYTARLRIYDLNQSTLALISPGLFPSPDLFPGTPPYPSEGLGAFPMFDTMDIPDDFMFPRSAGRIGVQASLADGDSYLSRVHPLNLVFAEYRSRPLQSITPVQGARLFVGSPSNLELFSSWSAQADSLNNTPLIASDSNRYITGDADQTSTAVTVINPSTGASPLQGAISNLLTPPGDSVSGITDFSQFHIEFSLWVTSTAINAGSLDSGPLISMALISTAGNVIPITIADPQPDQWTSYSIDQPLMVPYPIPGLYQMVIYYNGSISDTFWIDGVSFHEHPMEWSARSIIDDPWESNYAPWTPFRDLLNSNDAGIKFHPMGSQLQVRGRALRSDVVVTSPPKVIPKYAELGRFAWPDTFVIPDQPTPHISVSHTARSYTFDGTGSTGTNPIGGYYWILGDGSYMTGPVVQHTFTTDIPSGTQLGVVLIVVDSAGQMSSNSATSPTVITLS